MRHLIWVDRPKETVDEREELGMAAKAFLSSPLYSRALSAMAEGYLQDIAESKPDQQVERQHAYDMLCCVRQLNDAFTGWQADAKMIAQARAEKARQDGDAPVEEEEINDG